MNSLSQKYLHKKCFVNKIWNLQHNCKNISTYRQYHISVKTSPCFRCSLHLPLGSRRHLCPASGNPRQAPPAENTFLIIFEWTSNQLGLCLKHLDVHVFAYRHVWNFNSYSHVLKCHRNFEFIDFALRG